MTRLMKGRTIVRTMLLLGAATITFASAEAQAGSPQLRHYSIPAGEAGASIQQLAKQSGIQVMAPQADLRGVRTQPVRGDYTAADALDRMLAGTSLEAVSSSGGAVIVRKRAARPETPQEAPAVTEATPEEQIIVTGSRIKRAGVDTLYVATVTDEKEIKERGYTNIIQALQDTPGFGPAGNSQIGASQANLGIAQSYSNFFGLGSQRTLSLVNGRRFVSSNTVSGAGGSASPGSQVDVNLIPVGLVRRVETVAIGGAPVYGSDAIAGTVNFILKDDFDGLELTGQTQISDRGDAGNQTVRALFGKNFAGGRGNIVLAAEYSKQDGMPLSTRFPNYYALVSSGNTNRTDGIPALTVIDQRIAVLTEGGLPFKSGTLPADATYITANGLVGGQPLQFGPDGNLVPFNLGARYTGDSGGAFRNGGDGLNPADHALLLSPNDRMLFNALGNFDITDHVNAYFEGSYAHTSGTKLSDLFQFAAPGVGGPSITMNINNPFLNAQARQILALNGVTTFRFNRNLNDIADSRPAKTKLDVYRIVAGVKGDFGVGGETWNWDVSANYGRSKNVSEFNQINQTRFLNAINAVSVGGVIQCAVGGDCVPLNLFGRNAFSPAARDYVIDKGLGTSINEMTEYNANLGGKLPFGIAGNIPFSIGYEHRKESGSFDGNAILNGGLSLLSGAVAYPDAPKRGFNTDEIYGEAILPLINDGMNVPLLRSVQAEGSVRYVDQSITGGDVTWSAGGRIVPRLGGIGEGLTFRGVFTHAIRSPSIVELFLNATPVARAANDVCASTRVNTGPNPAVRLANCTAALAAVGGPAPTAFSPTTNLNSPFGIVGGNSALDAEKADSWSVGFVYTPPAIPRLRLSVDYSHVRVNGAISRFTLTTAEAACYDSPNFPNEGACQAFTRLNAAQAAAQTLATGRPRVAGDIADNYLESYYNSAIIDFAGIIGEIDYRFGVPNIMGGEPGALRLGIKSFYIDKYDTKASGAAPLLRGAGQLGTPRWKVNGHVGYDFDPFDLDVQAIWTSAVKLDRTLGIEDTPINDINAYLLMNATFGAKIGDRYRLQFSVRNLLDREVPYPAVVTRNFGSFDPIGRTFTVQATAKF